MTEQGRQAEEIRNLAMESLSESKKRKSADDKSPTSSKQNKGSETLCYLRNKYEQDIALREKEIEIEKQKLDLQKAQYEQYVQTQTAMQQQIAQTQQLIFSLFEKLVSNN